MIKTKNKNNIPITEIKISLGDSDCDKAMVKMLKNSSSVSIVSETKSELIVRPVEQQKQAQNITPKVEMIKVASIKKNRSPLFRSLFKPKAKAHYDFSKIISISGFLLNK